MSRPDLTVGQSADYVAPSTEFEARVELAAAYRMVADLGWTDLGATHLSVAVPDEDAYLMLALGLLFDEVTADNLVKVGMDGRPVDAPPGVRVNPAGVTIHTALHRARPELRSVLHIHTAASVAVSCHPEGLLPLSQHALRFHDNHGVHDYEGVALDGDEGPRLAADLGDGELLLLRNHGLLTVGPDLPQAFSALYYAEIACRMQVATLANTDVPVMPTRDVCDHTRRQYAASTRYCYRDWAALLRRVAKNHPDWSCQ